VVKGSSAEQPVPFCWPTLFRWSALIIVCILGLSARLYRINEAELETDEAFSWRLTGYPPTELVERTARDVHPPLYYLLLKGWAALWGDSLRSLRGLSVLFGGLTIVIAYAICREGCRGARASCRGGGLLASFLVAVHISQVVPSRTVRMYSLGIFLTALTIWLLLRASRAQRNSAMWWVLYGTAAAAFAWTHNYAFFSLLAQAIFMLGLWVSQTVRPDIRRGAPRRLAVGYAGTVCLAVLLYGPWLHSLWRQTRAVQGNYWIDVPSWELISETFTTWTTGLNTPDAWGLYLAFVLVMLALVSTIWRGSTETWLLLSSAVVPWVCALSISLLSGRSIFLARCLGFAQISYLCLWGVLWDRLGGLIERLAISAVLGVCCLTGLGDLTARLPAGQPAIAQAADYLRVHSRDGDVVEVYGAPAVNRIRFYLSRSGVSWVLVRSEVSLFGKDGHIIHLFALSESDMDFRQSGEHSASPTERVWYGAESDGGIILESRWPLAHEEFTDESGGRYLLTLYGEK
jgi:mannosyltransferase